MTTRRGPRQTPATSQAAGDKPSRFRRALRGLERHRPSAWKVVALVGTVLAVLIAVSTWHYLSVQSDIRSAEMYLSQAVKSLATHTPTDDARRMRADAQRAVSKIETARHEINNDPLVSLLGDMPLIGPRIRSDRLLIDAGGSTSRALLQAARIAADFADHANGTTLAQRLMSAISGNAGTLQLIADELRQAERDIIGASRAGDLPLLGSPISKAHAYAVGAELWRAAEVASAMRDIPTILGMGAERRYLLLGVDNSELLPSGGLVAEYAIVTANKGRLSTTNFAPAASLRFGNSPGHGPYATPPAPLNDYLLRGNSWDLTTALWSPDFPTAAGEASHLARLAGVPRVDGVVAVDLNALRRVIAAVGPVHAAGHSLTPGNPPEKLIELTVATTPSPEPNFSVVSALVSAAWHQILQAGEDQWTGVARQLWTSAADRDLQVYLSSGADEQLVRALGWDGQLDSPSGDSLAVVDANVLSTKLNLTLREEARVNLQFRPDGRVDHLVTLTYQNDDSAWARGKNPTLVKRLMCVRAQCQPGTLGGIYGGYVRIFVPPDAGLESVNVNGTEVGASESGTELRHAVFGRFFTADQGTTATVQFRYTTAAATQRCGSLRCFRLFIRRQAGTRPMSMLIRWSMPRGRTVRAFSFDGQQLSVPKGVVSIVASRDHTLELGF